VRWDVEVGEAGCARSAAASGAAEDGLPLPLSSGPLRAAARRAYPVPLAARFSPSRPNHERSHMSLLWIILIVVLVLALLGFFGRSYW
jgi:hypothetical protein